LRMSRVLPLGNRNEAMPSNAFVTTNEGRTGDGLNASLMRTHWNSRGTSNSGQVRLGTSGP
jgi:hypothetical protein